MISTERLKSAAIFKRFQRLQLFLLSCQFISLACGQFVQQPSPLIGTGGFPSSAQGSSLAISADGNTAIVGGPGDNGGGSVWIFVRSSAGWVQQGNKLQSVGLYWSIPSRRVGGAFSGREHADYGRTRR